MPKAYVLNKNKKIMYSPVNGHVCMMDVKTTNIQQPLRPRAANLDFSRNQKADSLCDERCPSCFDFLTFCRCCGHTEGKIPCHISFFVYTFCMLLEFSQTLNMTFKTFTKYSMVITKKQNYTNMAYF